MSRRHLRWTLAVGSLTVWFAGGCSRYPPAPEKPDISPREAGRAAIGQYDADNDGRLDGTEMKKCPSLWEARKRIDGNGDAVLTAEEITARINYWSHCGTIVMSGVTLITLDGKPLPGATVTLEPEEFLGPGFTACQGVTDETGRASIKGPDPKYPGIYLGLYRVKVSKLVGGRETIPARYNTQTELGLEATDDIPGVGNIEFHLKRK
jgi:hypothetical protein